MKVGDFQKCLRSLAELISTKAPAKELTAAADALTPFAAHTMEQFATFLKLAEAKYRETGQLPDGKPVAPPKSKPEPVPKKGAVPKVPAATMNDFLAAVATLKVRLRTDSTLTKDDVAAELSRFEKLPKDDLVAAVHHFGLQAKPKTKGEALKMIVNYTVAVQSGVERSDA